MTPDDIKSDIKAFQSFSDGHINQCIERAKVQAKADQITDPDALKMAQIDFARHLLVVDRFEQNGGVTNASIMGNSQAIADPNSYPNGDQYLQDYNKIASQFGNPANQARVITQNGLGGFDLF